LLLVGISGLSSRPPSLIGFALKRALQAIPLILAVIIFTFILIHLTPGDPTLILTGQEASEQYIREVRASYGLDKPLLEQLTIYLTKVLQGDLGQSYFFGQPVLTVILTKIPNTLVLMGIGLSFASVLGVILGVVSARKVYSVSDNVITVISLIGYSLPVMWFGQALLLIFAIHFRLFPAAGMMSFRSFANPLDEVLDLLWHLALPVLVIGTFQLALITRMTRASLLEVLSKDFIITARAKGLKENVVLYKHALKNALPPIIAIIGVNAGTMFAGAILTETVFSWPGMGRFLYDSIFRRDYPAITGLFIVITVAVVVANFVADLAHAYIDPRARLR
jgi:peptide/nickel transport system permease protein